MERSSCAVCHIVSFWLTADFSVLCVRVCVCVCGHDIKSAE